MITKSLNITYRLYEDKDIPAIIKLWAEDSGWGQSVYALHQNNSQRLAVPLHTIKGMITAQNEPILKKIGYTRDDFRFAFGSFLLDATIDFEKVKAANWYMTLLG